MIIGVLLALWALFASFVIPLAKGVGYLVAHARLRRNRLRALGVTAAIVGALAVLLFVVPVPLWSRAEGVIWVPDDAVVRAGADGFVSKVAVDPGSIVRRGRPLVLAAQPRARAQDPGARGAAAAARDARAGRAADRPRALGDHARGAARDARGARRRAQALPRAHHPRPAQRQVRAHRRGGRPARPLPAPGAGDRLRGAGGDASPRACWCRRTTSTWCSTRTRQVRVKLAGRMYETFDAEDPEGGARGERPRRRTSPCRASAAARRRSIRRTRRRRKRSTPGSSSTSSCRRRAPSCSASTSTRASSSARSRSPGASTAR